ncbi:MAG: single-stranded-DNA-specific exonuclease RecJ [Oscillospiraceae bacterium]|nr:single-stranded-DNA-specific exonuclease RecJ [Oscillospiraceae bacterium]
MTLKKWNVSEPNAQTVKALRASLGIGELTARVLAARGCDEQTARRALFDDGAEFADPFQIKDMDRAAARVNAALEKDEMIAVFGDYDVDGVTSTALMYQYLLSRGGRVACSLPTRDSTGYGLSRAAIDNMKKYGVSLIITVDNGVSAGDEIAYAAAAGVDVVVCDHHLPPSALPQAAAVVDPLRADDASGCGDLAGVGVALALAAACEGCGIGELLPQYGVFAAIGTVSDIMPLTGQNRAIVKAGFAQLPYCENEGIRALCGQAGLDIEHLTAQDIAFAIAPRINAAGRMGNAALALQLLITEDPDAAQKTAQQLCELNRARQTTEQEINRLVEQRIDEDPALLKKPVIVISGEDLHAGVIGIVCSRLVERYGKPAVVISVEGDTAKGSGRSVPGFSLHEAIAACAPLLTKFGGHDMAAGFMLAAPRIEEFKQALFAFCRTHRDSIGLPELRVDAYITPADIDEPGVAELSSLAPFGCGNEEPVFAVRGATLVSAAPLGEKHTRLTLRAAGGTLTGALFGVQPQALPFAPGDALDAAFSLSIYEGAAKNIVSVKFRELHRADLTDEDFRSVAVYRDHCCGRPLTKGDAASVAPSREDIAYVYRKLKTAGTDRYDHGAVSVCFRKLPIGRTEAAFDVLEELGLVKTEKTPDGRRLLRAADSAEKHELSDAPTFRELNGAAV